MEANLNSRIDRLIGQQQVLVKQKSQMIMRTDTHASIIANDDAVLTVLNQLQEEYSTGSVKLYSDLLTSMVRSVMPEYNQQIVLEPGVYANKPSLDIVSISPTGVVQPIDDQGGSISNLLASGLRFIGLALSSNRRIAILDECDCWLEGRLVPQFLTVIHDMCIKLGLQVIFVSHHQDALGEVGVAKVSLQKDSDVTRVLEIAEAKIVSTQHPYEEVHAQAMEGTGLRYIRLVNYMSHADSTIPLQRGLTALVGDNNIGKSVITRAFSDLLANNRSSNRIRNDEQEGYVELGLEGGYSLKWQLNAKKDGHAQGSYSLLGSNGEVLHLDRNATAVPDWVDEYLAMAPVNGLNLHIGHQKDPLFILNPAISKHKRAELIQLGHEYDQINHMIKKHRANVKSSRSQLKELQQATDDISERLSSLKGIDVLCDASSPVSYSKRPLELLESFLSDSSGGTHKAALQAIFAALNTPDYNEASHRILHNYLHADCGDLGSMNAIYKALSDTGLGIIESMENQLSLIKSHSLARQGAALFQQAAIMRDALALNSSSKHDSVDSVSQFIALNEQADSLQRDYAQSTAELNDVEARLLAQGHICPTCKQLKTGAVHATNHH